jgi:hypothetical protein
MKFEIDQEILAKAGQCTKGHRCLSGRPEDLCEATLQLTGRQNFICNSPDPCFYKEPFGSSFFCACAVRRAIHRKYGK